MPYSEIAAQHAALPPLHFDGQTLRAAGELRDERIMQGFRNDWRNEERAQLQLQQDEINEERIRLEDNRELMLRQQELEANTNNASGSNIAGYQAQNTNNYDQDDDIYGDQQYPLGPAGTPPPSRPPSPPPPPPPHRGRNRGAPAGKNRGVPAGRNRGARAGRNRGAPVGRNRGALAGRHSLGPMNLECPHCHALHFATEKLSASTRNSLKFGMCCLTGQIDLPPFPPAPIHLRDLFDGTSPHSLEFKTNIC